MKFTPALVLGGGVLLAQACAPGVTPEEVFDRASRSVAMVHAADAAGKIVGRASGVFVDQDLLVTNCHVIARGKTFQAGHRQKRSPGRLVAYDADKDLCVLQVRGLEVTPARIGDAGAARVGQRVYAIGAPEGFELTFSEGLVSGLREAAGGRYLQTTAALSEGSSGGGLFDDKGCLIGITAFVFSSGQNLNFAAPVQWAVELARKASGAAGGSAAEPMEFPPALARQWRHPVLK